MRASVARLAGALALVLLPAPQVAPQAAPQEGLAAVQQELRKFDPKALHALLERADKDPDPAIRRAILDRLSRLPLSGVREALEDHAANDPDAGVALLALERLRLLHAQELGRLFARRLALAHGQGDKKALEALVPQHQRWVTLARGALLPAFLQGPPDVFAALDPEKPARVLVFGDINEPGPEGPQVAAAALAYHRGKRFDLGLTVGDNFPPRGVTGLDDPRWKAEWEDLYGPLGIPIYASTGNHDWGFSDSPAAEISRQSPTWRMPGLYYSFAAGPAQFFAIATQAWSETQAAWLDRELARSTARWKVVYGHHPIHSYGGYGPTPELQQSLLPVLKGRAHLYLFGHEHIVQDLEENGVHFLNTPAAGQKARPAATGPLTIFADSFYGFAALDVSPGAIRIELVDGEGKVRYRKEIR
jgi:hypothetical protein